MAEQRRPGWYDDGQGQTRWWSGRGWTAHIQAAPTPDPLAGEALTAEVTAPVSRPARRRDRPARAVRPAVVDRPARPSRPARAARSRSVDRPAPRTTGGFRGRTLLITAGAAAVLGMIVGAAGGGGGAAQAVDPTAGPEYVALHDRFTSAVSERDALQVRVDDAADEVTAMSDQQTGLDAAAEKLDARAKALDKRQAKLDKKAKTLTRAAVTVAAAPKETAPEETVQEAPTSVYYQNCDAARADGAAPVHRGDPGYASHLDRDGDGVGCE